MTEPNINTLNISCNNSIISDIDDSIITYHLPEFIDSDDENSSNSSYATRKSRKTHRNLSLVYNKTFFTYSELEKSNNIIDIFYAYDLILFTNDFRLRHKKCFDYFWMCSKNYITQTDFPGIMFLSSNSINLIKKCITTHNKQFKQYDIDDNQICFDEGDIYENMVYKKLQIHNKLLFVPYNKYQLKLTEYKLRSFCQIMEELGALEIEIDFNHLNINSSIKKTNIELEEFNYIASALGFSASNDESTNENITYKLKYPYNNTLMLNEKELINKINKGKFIINKKMFDSNLELQFILSSRCRHYIENYSTVFTLDNTNNYDKNMIYKLKSHNFNCGFEYQNSKTNNLKISINTRVKFCTQNSLNTNLLGDNVSSDSSGFNYLMGSINQDNFNNYGIFKIISFIEMYIKNVLKKNKIIYKKITNLFKIINKEFSFYEYKNMLLEYFNINSQWINFINFINVLKFKSVSYDKLGFLILLSQNTIPYYIKNQKIIDFIRHLCEESKLEDHFWQMLEPNEYYLIIYKLDKYYNIIRKYNWFNVQKLLRDIKKYTPNIKDKHNSEYNNEKYYEKLYINFKLGHNNSQYEKYIKPFLYKYINLIFKDRLDNINKITTSELYFSNLIYNSIKPNHFNVYEINSLEKLKDLIYHKFNQIDEACKFYIKLYNDVGTYNLSNNVLKTVIYPFLNSDISNIFYIVITNMFNDQDKFKTLYPYLFKKLSYILDETENSLQNSPTTPKSYHNKSFSINITFQSEIKELINISKITTNNVKKISLNIIKKLLLFDFNINKNNFLFGNITTNYYNNVNNYVRQYNENKLCFIKLKFFIELVNFIINQNYTCDNNEYKEIFFNSKLFNVLKEYPCLNFINNNNIDNKTINLIKNIIHCYDYKHLIEIVILFLSNILELEISNELIILIQ
jgi:hypothetical protein